jgi:hypothetical protein
MVYLIATRLRAERSGVRIPEGQEILLYSKASRRVLGPTQPPDQCVAGAVSLGTKKPGRKASA